MPNEDKVKALLSDLGRATLRGVRKCHKCGTYNGTRGLSCKNKACDVVFKEAGEKRKLSTEACKLVTGSGTQVFSVRVRDKGPDYRGFVQLPLTPQSGDHHLDGDASLIAQSAAALCFVDTCQRSFDTSILKCHEKTTPLVITTCQHIEAAMRCFTEAQPIPLKHSVLSTLNVSDEIKQSVWQLGTETAGPLVQRVSRHIMAVKCKASPKHPLGYLHFSFFMSKLKDRVENKYFCSCAAFKGQVKYASDRDDINFKKCIHFYCCIAAFAGDLKLFEEFSYFINLDKIPLINAVPINAADNHQQLVAILNDEVEVLRDEDPLLDASEISISDDTSEVEVHNLGVLSNALEVQMHEIDPESLTFTAIDEKPILDRIHSSEPVCSKRKLDPDCVLPLTSVTEPVPAKKKCVNKKFAISVTKKSEPSDEKTVSLSFLHWLSSVTERINQAMHFQFDGKPEPLVFHIPQIFFDCLRDRMSCGNKKKRLPNFVTGFVRKDAVPLGTFTKYTWHITNIFHVKQIFETPTTPLQITKSFVQNCDGTYEPYQPSKDENEIFRKTNSQPLIKPLEMKTYLKVGNTSPDQTDPTPFLIEWIPDILPQNKIGELRLRFEFGHVRNGRVPGLISKT